MCDFSNLRSILDTATLVDLCVAVVFYNTTNQNPSFKRFVMIGRRADNSMLVLQIASLVVCSLLPWVLGSLYVLQKHKISSYPCVFAAVAGMYSLAHSLGTTSIIISVCQELC
jgi:hypothetical protein